MIRKCLKKLLSTIIITILLVITASVISAQSCDSTCQVNDAACLSSRISDCNVKLVSLQGQANTLSNQIAQFNTQISLTTLKITQTEEQIKMLGGRIDQLEGSLGSLSAAFSERAVETYKMFRSGEPVFLIISSKDLGQAISSFYYLEKIQEADRNLLIRLQKAQNIYIDEKGKQEELATELEKQKALLSSQKAAKANLLAVTRNDEKRYKKLLDDAQAELNALATSQFTGKRNVKRGELIGIMGNTGNSTGAHLHFGYYNINESEASSLFVNTSWYFSRYDTPVSALQSRTLHFEYLSCDDVTQPGGVDKPIGNGSFPWPMNNPRITQCFGHTPYSYVYQGNIHQGIDMVDSLDRTVRALDDGVAYFYRGTSSFGNNVRIFHSNGKMSLYMHLQ